jgi:histidinol-phosphate/aromatic aminotransferase/cobyric acid decarboxylase-like protein
MNAKITISLARDSDRPKIYRIRHDVYAIELAQHPPNSEQRLSDALDTRNCYIKAGVDGRIAGFVSITPPGQLYSVDKYFGRDSYHFRFDSGVYEVRLLTVIRGYRHRAIAGLLMYAALRWIEAKGGTRVVAIGRREVLSLYGKAGLHSLGLRTQSGSVQYELLAAEVGELRAKADSHSEVLRRLEPRVRWRLAIPFRPAERCHHGGASFHAIGEDFENLERSQDVVTADVLDAWFAPSPRVISALKMHLPFLLRTSPPVACEGMVRAIARSRKVPAESIVPGAGSSELIFLAFREWLSPASRILLLDPTYGEYGHVGKRLIGCKVDRLPLARAENYQVDLRSLEERLTSGSYNLVVIVNPNSPTGQHVERSKLVSLLRVVPPTTRVWLDETYVDYVGPDQSLEGFAAKSENVVVCKSMSKVYALSGVRAAYACAPPFIAQCLREISPPWAVSLPAQLAAVRALEDPEYYADRYRQTHHLREGLAAYLRELGFDVVPSTANFLLCHLPKDSADAATITRRCRERNVYIRDAGEISSILGSHALRIAVKDEAANARIFEALRWAQR